MKNKFHGIGKVFNFTLAQSFKGKSFKATLIIIALAVFAATFGLNILLADVSAPSPIEKVYVYDNNSGLEVINIFEGMKAGFDERFADVEFVTIEEDISLEDAINKAKDDSNESVVAAVGKGKEGFEIVVYVTDNKEISESEAAEIGELISDSFQSIKYANMDLTQEQIMALMVPSEIKLSVEGEKDDTNFAVTFLQLMAPAIFGFALYFMLIFYGQAIAKNVLSEKESKLMEFLLTGCKPYALIGGKVLAITASGLIQFTVWIVAGVAGYIIGDKVAVSMYPDYSNPVYEMFDGLKEMGLEDALSVKSIIFAVIALCVGFLFYCVLAGFFGSFLRKAEDLGSVMGIYTMLIVVGFMVSYMGTLLEKKEVIAVGRYVPICSPFMLPADILVGNMSTVESLISFGILILSTIIVIIATGKVYEMTVLYKGTNMFGKIFKKGKRV